jgi:arginyl-tRNA synthetase
MVRSESPKTHLTALFQHAASQFALAEHISIELERPKQASHGDFACNIAMQLAKALKRNPREVAQLILASFPASDLVEKTEIAGPGFINVFLKPAAWQNIALQTLQAGEAYGRSGLGQGSKVQIEFVSANPTGPLHVGHGRGAAFGDSLANVLQAAGYEVQREYYVNDAGRQMDILSVSAWIRYLELCGELVAFPANGYQGDYVRTRAEELRAVDGTRFVRLATEVEDGLPPLPEGDETAVELRMDALIERARRLLGDDFGHLTRFVLERQLEQIREVLGRFGVHFDMWYSERSLFDSARVVEVLDLLEARGHLYIQDGARWFRSTAFGDDKDRVVQRENGLYTYFASDIAYHLNKFERGFDKVINIWGADHHGYIPRVTGALQALGLDAGKLQVALVQFAVLYRNGQKASMSTRSGEFVTLRDLRREVGNDACRFFYVLRKSDQHLDFDLDLAKSQSNENPVYYIQYAHARVCSVMNTWTEAGGDEAELLKADLARLDSPREMALAAKLAEFPEIIEAAAADLAPHSVAFYLKDLAADFHSWYNAERMLVEDVALKDARVAMAAAVRQTIRNGMAILGVSCPASM